MQPFRKGRYLARLAETPADLAAAQRLRWLCFVARGDLAAPAGLDRDHLDARCRHLLVEDAATGALVCCCRVLALTGGRHIDGSYAAQFYDLTALESFDAPMLEIGRFCTHPASRDPDIIRIAWAALTRLVAASGAQMLFGCSSFTGTRAADHAEAFALLQARHLAPRRWWPRIKAPDVVRLSPVRAGPPDPRRALAAMPPLLRSYLALGGWVSDHAVVDPILRTLHVFTGVEIGAIPPARRRLLNAAAL